MSSTVDIAAPVTEIYHRKGELIERTIPSIAEQGVGRADTMSCTWKFVCIELLKVGSDIQIAKVRKGAVSLKVFDIVLSFPVFLSSFIHGQITLLFRY